MRKKPTFRRPALISSQARNVIIIFALFLQLLPLGVLSNPAHAAVDPNDLYIERTYEHAPELLQDELTVERLQAEIEGLLSSPARREAMRRDLAEVQAALGSGDASSRAARRILDLLG